MINRKLFFNFAYSKIHLRKIQYVSKGELKPIFIEEGMLHKSLSLGKNHEVTDTNVLYCEKTNLILQKKVLPNHLHDKAKLI